MQIRLHKWLRVRWWDGVPFYDRLCVYAEWNRINLPRALGHLVTVTYDGNGDVATVNIYGNRTTAIFHSDGRQIGSVDAYGNITTNVLDAAGRQVASIDSYGNRTTAIFDNANRQTASEDYLGNYATTVYNAAGQVSATVDQYGNRTTNIFDSYGRQVATQDMYGHFATATYNAAGQVEATVDIYGNTTTNIYDNIGRQTATVDMLGNAVTTVFDGSGRPQATVDALGNRTTNIFDAYGRQVATQDPLGYYTTTVFDAQGNAIATVDALGNRTTTVIDSQGRSAATIDALGNRATAIFDTYGRASAREDALAHYVTSIYDSYGRISATVDALGNRTTNIFDATGRQVATEDALGNYVTAVFDSNGRQSATVDPLGNRATTIYDSHSNVSATIDALGNSATTIFDSQGRAAASVDALGNRTSTIFDAYGRVSATENALGHYVTNIYDSYGRQSATVDSLGNRVTTVFDSYGRPSATVDQLGNRTTTVLDSLGREQNLIDASNNKTTFVYDAVGRESQQIDPLGYSATFAYDAAGHLTSSTDRLTRRIDRRYDAVGREIGETWVNADTSTANLLTFTYDANGNQLTAANFTGAYTVTYDAVNRASVTKDPWGNTLTHTYDAAGNRTVVADSKGGTTTSTYDADRELTSRKFGGTIQTPLRIDFTYTAAGKESSATRFSDLAGTTKVATTSVTYDAAGETTNLHHIDGSSANLANYTYTYDARGSLTTETRNGTAVNFTYDNAAQETADGTITKTYDATGNRNDGSNTTGTGNELSTDGTWNYTYDHEGDETKKVNIATGETWTYGYDQKNHITSIEKRTTDGGTLQERWDFKYDAYGNRAQTTLDSNGDSVVDTTERYAQDGWNSAKPAPIGLENWDVWMDEDGSNALQTRYLRGDVVDQLFARIGADTNAYWTLTDRLGTVRDVTDNSGVIKDTLTYDGYGRLYAETNSAYRGRYTWAGREGDSENHLLFNRARFYDPVTARWMSRDPLGFDAGDSNVYRYVKNNALSDADASGLFGFEVNGNTVTMMVKIGLTFVNSAKHGKWEPAREAKFSQQFGIEIVQEFTPANVTLEPREKSAKFWYWQRSTIPGCGLGYRELRYIIKDLPIFVPAIQVGIQNTTKWWTNSGMDLAGTVEANPNQASITSSTTNLTGYMYLDEDDIRLQPKPGGNMQVPAVHEFGHAIGLHHPGQDSTPRATPNSLADYLADAKALMGAGMEVRALYFQQWADYAAAFVQAARGASDYIAYDPVLH